MKSTIKALVKKENAEGLSMEDVPMPVLYNDSVLILFYQQMELHVQEIFGLMYVVSKNYVVYN